MKIQIESVTPITGEVVIVDKESAFAVHPSPDKSEELVSVRRMRR